MKNILIIEDDVKIQDLYQMVLAGAGYNVDTALDGEEGLQKIKAKNYDLIMLDIMLPQMHGLKVLQAIRDPNASSKNTPVLIITNLGQESIVQEAFNLGADGFIIKANVPPEGVLIEVNKLLDTPLASESGQIQK
jgi:chemosensory pili system protein ChpA (sensor histidine kinase/response regulator)